MPQSSWVPWIFIKLVDCRQESWVVSIYRCLRYIRMYKDACIPRYRVGVSIKISESLLPIFQPTKDQHHVHNPNKMSNVLRTLFANAFFWIILILTQNSINFDFDVPIRHNAALGQVMAWYRTVAPFYWHGLTLIPAWISNHMPSNMWDEITYPFLNFNGATVEV